MTEIERYKKAMEVAQAFICVMRKSVMIQSARREELAMEAAGQISTILNPPPVKETVEVEGWAVCLPDGFVVSIHATEPPPLTIPSNYKVVRVSAPFARPVPRPVERSAKVRFHSSPASTFCYMDGDAMPNSEFIADITWTETPKGE